MDEVLNQILNEKPVQGQIPFNYGTVNINIGVSETNTAQPERKGSIWQVPYPRNPFFTGREHFLEQLHDNLTANKTTALTQTRAISGLGGIGKTQLAIEYAYRHRDNYQFVFWVNAVTHETLVADFINIAKLLQLPIQDEFNQNNIVALAKSWLTANNDWLLILDNADNLNIIYDFLPSAESGHILLTTREQATGTIALTMEVEKMNNEEGMLMLLRRAKVLQITESFEFASSENKIYAHKIVEAMDGLPLALDQAGAYIEEMKCNLSRYLDLYQKWQIELLKRRGRTPNNHPESVITTWTISFLEIEKINPLSAILLRLCTFLQSDFIPEEFLLDCLNFIGNILQGMITNKKSEESTISKENILRFIGLNQIYSDNDNENFFEESIFNISTQLQNSQHNPIIFDEIIGTLLRFSMIKRNSATSTLSIHRLMQAVFLDTIDEETRFIWATIVVKRVNDILPQRPTIETWPHLQRHLSQIINCCDMIHHYDLEFAYYIDMEAAHVLYVTGYFFHERGEYKDAESYYRHALKRYEQNGDSNKSNVAAVLNELGRLHLAQNKFDEAEQFYAQALSIFENLIDMSDIAQSNMANTFHEFARLCLAQENFEEALRFFNKALDLKRQLVPPDHPEIAKTLHEIAVLYRNQKKYEEAERTFLHVLQIEEKVLGQKHPDVATTLSNLGILYLSQGSYEKSEQCLKRALNIYEETVGTQHPSTILALQASASLYRQQGLFEKAIAFQEQALSIQEKTFDNEQSDLVSMLLILSKLYHEQNLDTKAEQTLVRLIKLLKQENFVKATVLQNLAAIYMDQERFEDARVFYENALSIFQTTASLEDIHIAYILRSLGVLYYEQGSYEKAKTCYEKVINIFAKELGSDHPETLDAIHIYSIIQISIGYLKQISNRNTQNIRFKRKGRHKKN